MNLLIGLSVRIDESGWPRSMRSHPLGRGAPGFLELAVELRSRYRSARFTRRVARHADVIESLPFHTIQGTIQERP